MINTSSKYSEENDDNIFLDRKYIMYCKKYNFIIMSYYKMVTDNNILVITIYVITKSICGVMIYKNNNISSTIDEPNNYNICFYCTPIFVG